MFVSSAPAAGFKVHNKKGYDLSSPAVLSPWFKLRDTKRHHVAANTKYE